VIRTELTIQGMEVDLGEQRELLLFRIFQEITNNSLKHSGSDVLQIDITYTPELFTMTVQDQGKGFDTGNQGQFKGLGLENIRQRAALIGATADMESSLGMGCSTTIKLDLRQL